MIAASRQDDAPPEPMAEVCEVDGGLLEVLHGGGGDVGPGLVFLHEGLGSATQWKDFPCRVAAELGLTEDTP